MRIIGGRWKGLRLTPVGKGDTGAHLRPTSDRVRESLFNLLMGGRYGDPMTDSVVLDLFAGTGALGLEALSRGAARVTFVDDGRVSSKLLSANVKLCGATEARHVKRDATRLPKCDEERANLIFHDPPYGKGLGEKALASALEMGWLATDALIVWEESHEIHPPAGVNVHEKRHYGDTQLNILRLELS